MRVSTRGWCGLRATFELARCVGEGPVPMSTVAERQDLSPKHLHAQLTFLKSAGLVRGVLGPGRGFALTRPFAQVRLSEILRVLEGPTSVVHGFVRNWQRMTLIASTCDAGVKVLHMTSVDDVVLKNGRVCGVVVNWTPVGALPRQITCVNPVSLEARVVVDATGHDAAVVEKLAHRGLVELTGMGPMDAGSSEDAIVENTGEWSTPVLSCAA